MLQISLNEEQHKTCQFNKNRKNSIETVDSFNQRLCARSWRQSGLKQFMKNVNRVTKPYADVLIHVVLLGVAYTKQTFIYNI